MLDLKFRTDARVFERKMGAIGEDVIPYAKTTYEALAEWAHGNIKALTPPPKYGKTEIRELWEMDVSVRGTLISYIIKNTYKDPNVIVYLEYGTSPRIIYPTGSGPLHWVDIESGADVFARVVKHPGTKPQFMVTHTEAELNKKLGFYEQATFKYLEMRLRSITR